MLELNNFKFISDYENCKNFRKIWLLLTLVLSKQYYALRNLEKLISRSWHDVKIKANPETRLKLLSNKRGHITKVFCPHRTLVIFVHVSGSSLIFKLFQDKGISYELLNNCRKKIETLLSWTPHRGLECGSTYAYTCGKEI